AAVVALALVPLAGMAAALLFLARAVTHSWGWAGLATAGAAVFALALVVGVNRWVSDDLDQTGAWMNVLGAGAFGAGGRGVELPSEGRHQYLCAGPVSRNVTRGTDVRCVLLAKPKQAKHAETNAAG